ncbi:MAG TPA: cell division protein FtsZ, partial [Porphyromonadaceae bacterium]|nr:cell division protein FtsZ [Porphyromonadaceae bacterium]
MMEEMNALHDFMSKFSREIEVIWGAAVEESLGEEVKVTLLATGFSITSVPGIKEHQEEKTRAEEIQEQIERDAKLEQEKRDKELIEKYYGKTGLKTLTTVNYRQEPFVLTIDELDDDKVLEALEKTPVFKREADFNPRAFQSETHPQSTSLFD